MPPVNKKDVFVILAELKRSILGISDQPKQMDGFIVSFLPTGQAINPDDFKKPWKPNISINNPAAPPSPDTVTPDIGKRYESLANTCTLVDSKIRINEVYQAIEDSSTISQSWEIIINGANVVPPVPAQAAFQKEQRDKYLPRLRKTIKDEDGEEVEVDTREYKSYREYREKYWAALRKYSNEYMVAMSNTITANMWGITGKIPLGEATSAWNEWTSLGNKQFIEEAIDNLAAMGSDAAAHMIAEAKKKFEAFRIATNGIIPVTSQYVEIFPSNWCEKNAGEDGWTNYDYTWEKETVVKDSETTSFSAGGGISLGFWSAKANVSYDKREEHSDRKLDNLEIKVSYAILDVNRPWLDTLLFDMNTWYLVGKHKKGDISTGKMDQVFPSTGADTWLPLIPKKIIAIKNLWIKATGIHEHFDALTTSVGVGGSVGIGPFSLSGNYSKSKSHSSFTAEKEGEGLSVKGVQIIGWISNLVQECPKIDSPE